MEIVIAFVSLLVMLAISLIAFIAALVKETLWDEWKVKMSKRKRK